MSNHAKCDVCGEPTTPLARIEDTCIDCIIKEEYGEQPTEEAA